MSGVLGPFQEPGFGPTFADLLARIQNLERTTPRAIYEIKVFGDDELVTVGDGAFKFAIPRQLNGWILTRLDAFVTVAPVAPDELIVELFNDTTSLDMAPVEIEPGDKCNVNTFLDDDNAPVASCDEIWVNVTAIAGGDAMGLGVILEFSP